MKKFVPLAAIRVPLFAALLVGAISHVAQAQSVPSPWTARDVGGPVLAGSATHSSGVFTVNGAGSDVWGTADQFMFVYQRITGDVDIRAKVEDLDGSSGYAKAGVMIRATLYANSPHAFSHVTVGAGVRAVRRLTSGGSSIVRSGTSTGAPKWLRAVRRGTTVTTYWSSTGSTWTAISTDTIALGSTAYVGIAVNSRSTGSRATGRFSNVSIGGQSLPSGQQSSDIGSPAIAGSAAYSGGTYTIKGAGVDIWSTADQFRYVYQPVTGNLDVVARVASLTYVDAWTKAGVMIRESLAANARHATTVVSAGKGYAFQRRPDPGAYTEHTGGGSGTAPGWVRLVRTGDTFESYRSSNGSTWTRIGTDVIPMGDTVYVGIAVTSRKASQATTAVVDSFKLTAAAAANRAPAVSITSPASGTQVTAPATVTIAATASDPENRMMSVDFYAGSTLVARDTTAPYSASWSATTAGTYSLTAVAHDADGGSSTSSAVSVAVKSSTTTTPPTKVAFMKSADHATKVTKYVLKVYAAGVNVSTATPVATSDLGKPTPSSTGEIVVDRASFFSALAVGNYQATVTAVGSSGQTASAAITFTR